MRERTPRAPRMPHVRANAPLLALGLAALALAAPVRSHSTPTEPPDAVMRALRDAGLPASAASIVVAPLDGPGLEVALNRDVPRNPASTMKLLTTYAALRALGPAYRWHTDVVLLGSRDGATIRGDLGLRGGGDPALVVEQLWLLVQQLRGLGIRDLRGDLVLDRSAFRLPPHDTAAFDGDALRSYNVGPDALLVNYNSIAYRFVPDVAANRVFLAILPPLAGSAAPQAVAAAAGPCGDWRGKLRADFSKPLAPRVRGAVPLACGERSWNLAPRAPDPYLGAGFRGWWEGS
ncbi:MAG: D-alanyl-D-alanine carboxypeptidase, partial [Steroidobacteraceae bacterium]